MAAEVPARFDKEEMPRYAHTTWREPPSETNTSSRGFKIDQASRVLWEFAGNSV